MNEEKVLTLRGKRAVWAPAPAGGGGNDREFVVEIAVDYHGEYSGNKTYEEMQAAAAAGKNLVAYLTSPGGDVMKSAGGGAGSNGDVSAIGFRFFNLVAELTVGCFSDNTWGTIG